MYAKITKSIEERMKVNWSLTPVEYDNIDFLEVAGQSFIRLRIHTPNKQRIAIGGLERVTGYIDGSIFVPSNSSRENIDILVDEFSKIFELWDDGEIEFKLARINRVGQVNEWYQLQVIIPFTFDTCRKQKTP